jgi:hypothetical protein
VEVGGRSGGRVLEGGAGAVLGLSEAGQKESRVWRQYGREEGTMGRKKNGESGER